jgi:hypothetical protein
MSPKPTTAAPWPGLVGYATGTVRADVLPITWFPYRHWTTAAVRERGGRRFVMPG